MGVNSLPKTVARQHSGCDLNPGPTAPESSTLTLGYRATLIYDIKTKKATKRVVVRIKESNTEIADRAT